VTMTAPEQPEAEACEALRLQGTMVLIEGRRYLDVEAPSEELEGRLNNYLLFVMPLHYIARVEMDEQRLSLEMIDPKWLDWFLTRHPNEIQHVRASTPDGELPHRSQVELSLTPPPLLTGSTSALQDFLRKHGSDDREWVSFDRFTRYQSLLPEDGEE